MTEEEVAERWPEHAKQSKIVEESQAIGAFLDSENHPYVLAEYVIFEGRSSETLVPVSRSIQQILADYFEIDLNKIEAEKRDMLASLTGGN